MRDHSPHCIHRAAACAPPRAPQGIGALASGLGPIGFAWLFSYTTRTDSPVHAPQASWLVACGIALVGVAVVATLDCSLPGAHGKEGAGLGEGCQAGGEAGGSGRGQEGDAVDGAAGPDSGSGPKALL